LEQEPRKRKRKSNEIELKKQLVEEEYNKEAHEQRYKRLIHLLNKSKFYSTYLINKIDDKNKKEKIPRKRPPPINNENISPTKRKEKKEMKDVEKYNLQEYISTEVNSKI